MGAQREENMQSSENGRQRVFRWHEQNTFFGQIFNHESYSRNNACEGWMVAGYDRLAFTMTVATVRGIDGSDSHVDK